jgi:hypothetical protein
MRTTLGLSLAVGLFVFWSPATLRADAVYTYTGTPYTFVVGPTYTTSMFVSGSFTLSSALADNLAPQTVISSLVTAFTFTDGVQTFTESPDINWAFDIGTDASGNINSWFICAGTEPGFGGPLPNFCSAFAPGGFIELISNFPGFDGSFASGEVLGVPNGSFGETFDSGSWTSSVLTAVPEPSSLLLLATGLLGLGLLGRRRMLAA